MLGQRCKVCPNAKHRKQRTGRVFNSSTRIEDHPIQKFSVSKIRRAMVIGHWMTDVPKPPLKNLIGPQVMSSLLQLVLSDTVFLMSETVIESSSPENFICTLVTSRLIWMLLSFANSLRSPSQSLSAF